MIKNRLLMKLRFINPYYYYLILRDMLDFKKKFLTIQRKNFEIYKNKFIGKKIVLVGCGESINSFEGIDNAIYIGINRSYKFNKIKLDFLFIQDNFPEGMKEANIYEGNSCKKMYGQIPTSSLYIQNHTLGRIKECDIKEASANLYYLSNFTFPNFTKDFSQEYVGDYRGTVFSALQFAIYTGSKDIYLVGCDCSTGHFYSQKKDKLNYQVKIWKKIKKILSRKYPDVRVYSVNPVNLKGLFIDIYQEDK